MFELEKSYRFEAGHTLDLHDGKCAIPHGHSYILTIHIHSDTLISSGPRTNMVMDFNDLNLIVNPMIEKYFDHKWLNNTLQCNAATVEYIARWIFDYLEPFIPCLHAISLDETATSRVTYRKIK